MKLTKWIFVVAVTLGATANAKITIFSSQSALTHVLQSQGLSDLLGKDRSLGHLELANVSIQTDGRGDIGTEYELTFTYAGGPGSLESCNFSASVEVLKVQFSGITASKLSEPRFSRVNCVH